MKIINNILNNKLLGGYTMNDTLNIVKKLGIVPVVVLDDAKDAQKIG